MIRPGVLTSRFVLLSLALVLLSLEVPAQGVFTLRLRGQDGSGGVDTLLFGRDPRGSYCIDPVTFFDGTRPFTEFELPPVPPSGVFDIRHGNHRAGLGGCSVSNERGNGLRFDVRGSTGVSQVDTFQVRFQVGTSGPITLFWQTGLGVFCDSMRVKDSFGGVLVNVNMLTNQSVIVTNPAITSLQIFMYGGGRLTLIAPTNGNTVPPTTNLQWNSVEDASRYRVQVATDSLFTDLFLHDSTVVFTNRIVSGLASPATYYWRVAAGSDKGWGAYSQIRSFRTGAVPTTPTLIAPPDGVTNQPTSLTFNWNRVPDGANYHLQIASDSNFVSGMVVNDSTLVDSFRVVSTLGFSTTYYWRVSARNGIGSSAFSTRRSFTTQLQPPPAPSLTSPSNGSTNVPTPVTLNWSIGGGGSLTYRVQVATNPNFTSGVVLDDSTVTTSSRQVSVANSTTFHWRVTARNAAGWGPPSSTFSFTTIVAAPAAPSLSSPADGATNVSITPTVVWLASATATNYRLQVARDTAFTQMAFDDSTLTGTSRQVGPLPTNTTHYWRVRARNVGGNSAYSSRWRFVTTAAPPIPVQVFPPDSAERVDRQATFFWNRVPGATQYHLQIATDVSFSTLLVNDSTIVDSAKQVAALPYGARLHWRIRSRNTAGASAFSVPRVFTVMLQPPAITTQVSPNNNASNQPVTPTLRWQHAALAARYHVQIALDTLMTNVFLNDTTIADSAAVVRVAPSTAYYWRVRGQNTEGTYGPFSLIRRFTTGNFVPAPPLPFYPANGDTGTSRTPNLRWVESPGALFYRVQVALDNLFLQVVADDSTLVSNSYLTPLLQANTQYFWRVRARGTAGWTSYSLIQRFSTGTLIVAVGEDPSTAGQPQEFVLHQNYPNPFNPSTTIQYRIGEPASVVLEVYTMLGQHIAQLESGHHERGTYTAVWNATDAGGSAVPSGLYFIRLRAVERETGRVRVATIKAVLMK